MQDDKLRRLRRNVRLIYRERSYAARQEFAGRWKLWLARAEAWQAWQEHCHEEDLAGPNVTIDGAEVATYENYFTTLETARILQRARRFHVPVPDKYIEKIELPLYETEGYRLTEEGQAYVLPKLEEAARARRQEVGYWLSLATGLIGALTGLAAIVL